MKGMIWQRAHNELYYSTTTLSLNFSITSSNDFYWNSIGSYYFILKTSVIAEEVVGVDLVLIILYRNIIVSEIKLTIIELLSYISYNL